MADLLIATGNKVRGESKRKCIYVNLFYIDSLKNSNTNKNRFILLLLNQRANTEVWCSGHVICGFWTKQSHIYNYINYIGDQLDYLITSQWAFFIKWCLNSIWTKPTFLKHWQYVSLFKMTNRIHLQHETCEHKCWVIQK